MDSIKNFDVISEDELSMVEGGGLGKAIIGGLVREELSLKHT